MRYVDEPFASPFIAVQSEAATLTLVRLGHDEDDERNGKKG